MFLLALGLAGAVLISGTAAAGGPAGLAAQDVQEAPEPWQPGRCYRVFPAERDQLYVFRVVEPPSGGWVRVQADPSSARVPGARPAAPLWLNTASLFAVQEWACSR